MKFTINSENGKIEVDGIEGIEAAVYVSNLSRDDYHKALLARAL